MSYTAYLARCEKAACLLYPDEFKITMKIGYLELHVAYEPRFSGAMACGMSVYFAAGIVPYCIAVYSVDCKLPEICSPHEEDLNM